MKVVIMAAGNSARWNNYLDIPKQLAVINGEPLLFRTIRLLKKSGIPYKNMVVTVREKGMFGKLPCKEIVGSNPDSAICKFLNAKGNLMLYGDVYYTEKAMNTILSDSNKIWFFGRSSTSRFTGKKWGEIFAVKADDELIKLTSGLKSTWELYRVYSGYRIDEDKTGPNWTEIDDYTDDIDSPEEYLEFKKHENFISK